MTGVGENMGEATYIHTDRCSVYIYFITNITVQLIRNGQTFP